MNTSIETCPSLEDLAAFLEGRLSGEERARIVAHLADCPDCYEVFAEAARFELSEEEEEDEEDEVAVAAEVAAPWKPLEVPPPVKVVPFPRRPGFRWISTLAAAFAVVAVGIPVYKAYYNIPNLTTQGLVSTGLSGKNAQDEFWSQWTNRGGNDSDSAASIAHGFLLGAHLVDLRLSLARKDEPGMDDALARIYGHLADLGPETDERAQFYKTARVQLSDGQLPKDFPQQAERMEASLRPEEYPYLDFGKWTEAGRLSALNQSPDFFEAPQNQKFLQAFLHHELKELEAEPNGVAGDLGEIEETLNTSAPSSLPYQDLRKSFENILSFYQKQSQEGLAPDGSSPIP